MSDVNTENDPRFDALTGQPLSVFTHYAVPSVLGLLALSSASMIDAMFLGNFVGAAALAAVNLTVPVAALLYAITYTLATGGSVTAGAHLGADRDADASDIFTKILTLSLILSVSLSGLAWVFMDVVVASLGANEELTHIVAEYLGILIFFAPGMILGLTMHSFIVVDGRPRMGALALAASAAVNIFLDWLLIVEYNMGIRGAAWATGIAYTVTFFIVSSHLIYPEARLQLKLLHGNWRPVARAALNGISEFTNELSVGLTTLLFNWIMISRLGTEGVAAFTIVEYILWLAVMICYGFAGAVQPLVSKNLGARLHNRMRAFLDVALISSVAVGITFILAILLIPETLIYLFLEETEQSTVAIALDFIKYFWPALLFVGMNIVLTAYLTALHKPMESAGIAVLRSLLLPAFVVYFLPIYLGLTGIYLAVPIAEFVTFGVALLLLRNATRSL